MASPEMWVLEIVGVFPAGTGPAIVAGARELSARVAEVARTTSAWAMDFERRTDATAQLEERDWAGYVWLAIAAPDGQTAVWGGYGWGQFTAHLVYNLSGDLCIAHHWMEWPTKIAGRRWAPPPSDPRYTTRAFVYAAARLLHAQAFAAPAARRDVLLAPYALRTKRPVTRTILAATDEVLEAAALLYGLDESCDEAGAACACALLKRHDRNARRQARRAKRTQTSETP